MGDAELNATLLSLPHQAGHILTLWLCNKLAKTIGFEWKLCQKRSQLGFLLTVVKMYPIFRSQAPLERIHKKVYLNVTRNGDVHLKKAESSVLTVWVDSERQEELGGAGLVVIGESRRQTEIKKTPSRSTNVGPSVPMCATVIGNAASLVCFLGETPLVSGWHSFVKPLMFF